MKTEFPFSLLDILVDFTLRVIEVLEGPLDATEAL